MLVLVVGLFLVTETAAHLDVVAALRPLSFHTVATNILFAIGFGSPIVLYSAACHRRARLSVRSSQAP